MGFNKKFILIVIAIVIMVILQVYLNNIKPIEFSFAGYKVYVGIFTIGIFFCLKWLIKLIINSVASVFVKFLLSKRTLDDTKSVNNIAHLILLSNEDFKKEIRNISVIDKYKNIMTALIIKNNIKTNYLLSKTELKEIDVHLLDKELAELLEFNKYSEALQLINTIIKKYSHDIHVVQDKIIKIAKYAKENNLEFKFNPKKSKYNLGKEFISNYEIEIEMTNFNMINDNNDKLKIVEYLYKKFPLHKKTGLYLLQFLEEYKTSKYSDERIISLVHNIFMANPNRELAYIFLKLYGQSNIFEVSQEMLQTFPNYNIEKTWFLLIIATNMKLLNIIPELITNIIECNKNIVDMNRCNNNIKQSEINNLNKFFIENYNILSSNQEILKSITNANVNN